jgi:hypothetical protein
MSRRMRELLEGHEEVDDATGKSLRPSIRLSSPFGKNILISRIFKSAYIDSRPVPLRGVAQRHETRGGMRWTREARKTGEPDADGEVVWFWRSEAGVKSAEAIWSATVATKQRSPGRARRKLLKPLRGGCRAMPV